MVGPYLIKVHWADLLWNTGWAVWGLQSIYRYSKIWFLFAPTCVYACLFVCLVDFLTSSSTTTLCLGARSWYNLVVDEDIKKPNKQTKQQLGYMADGSQKWRLTIFTSCHTETGRGDRDVCLSPSRYTDTDPASRKRAAAAGIEPMTWRQVVHSTTWAVTHPYDLGNLELA